MKRTMFITGVSGFLGLHMAYQAQLQGWYWRGLDSRLLPDYDIEPDCVKRLSLAGMAVSTLEGIDTLVHFAAYTSLLGFADDMAENYAVNVWDFITLLDLARKVGVRKVVYASSSAVYGDGLSTNFREDEPIDHTKLVSHYGKSKLIDEMIAASYADAFGMNILGIRYFNVYGPGDERKGDRCAPVQHFINSRLANEPIMIYGDGEQAKDFIWVYDAINVTFRLIEADARGVYNLGTGTATPFNRLAEIVGGPIEHIPHPRPWGYMWRTCADMTKLRSVIDDYRFVPIEEGIARMLGKTAAAA